MPTLSLKHDTVSMLKFTRYLGLCFVFIYFFVGGIFHFTATDFFVNIMPPYLPYHREIVYLTGVMEIAGALSILLPAMQRLGGVFLFALTIAVTPANVHMWLNPHLFPEVEPVFLSVRLVLQVLLLAIIWFSTHPPRKPV